MIVRQSCPHTLCVSSALLCRFFLSGDLKPLPPADSFSARALPPSLPSATAAGFFPGVPSLSETALGATLRRDGSRRLKPRSEGPVRIVLLHRQQLRRCREASGRSRAC